MEEQPKEVIDSLENIPRKEFVPNFGSKTLPIKKDDRKVMPELPKEALESTPLLSPKQLTMWGIIEALFIVLFQQALMVIFIKIFGIGLIVAASYSATVILFYYLFRTYIRKKVFHITLHGQGIKDNLILVAQGVFLCFLVAFAYDFILKLLDYTPKAQQVELLLQQKDFTLVAAYFMLVYSAPIWEEIVFRGILQDGLQQSVSPTTAIISTGIIFGLIHFDPDQMVPLILLGCIFGWMYHKSQSVFPSIIAHSFVNTLGAVNLFGEFGK
ncbi:type II CAAX endopeptidase family protein [Lentisphaera profundi]|uniref:Type II CAAX endopeptidase family protein n=1 Tax=Lentisphaera profundi TaxID=1658616 RepID=A0ABY7VR95_9BACT|nr:type II CAAX endopeptidase family protein [Lentisphaera profundi]WDE96391.1 type II CAAX endopeptidase family protein [Lentisphaera profundi]